VADKQGSKIPAIGLWILMPLVALFLGWSFNAAFLSCLSDSARGLFRSLSLSSLNYGPNVVPYTERVFQTAAVALVLLCGLALCFSFWISGPFSRRKMVVLGSAALFPVLMWGAASTARLMAEKGLITPVDLGLKLAPGEKTMVAELEFTGTRFGVGVKSLVDSRSVAEIVWDHTISLWVNHKLFTLLLAAALLAVLVRFVQLGAANRAAEPARG
jgi:hypothetical protein